MNANKEKKKKELSKEAAIAIGSRKSWNIIGFVDDKNTLLMLFIVYTIQTPLLFLLLFFNDFKMNKCNRLFYRISERVNSKNATSNLIFPKKGEHFSWACLFSVLQRLYGLRNFIIYDGWSIVFFISWYEIYMNSKHISTYCHSGLTTIAVSTATKNTCEKKILMNRM